MGYFLRTVRKTIRTDNMNQNWNFQRDGEEGVESKNS